MSGETQLNLYCLSCISSDPSEVPAMLSLLLTMTYDGVSLGFKCPIHGEPLVRFRGFVSKSGIRNEKAVADLLRRDLNGMDSKKLRSLLSEIFIPNAGRGHK